MGKAKSATSGQLEILKACKVARKGLTPKMLAMKLDLYSPEVVKVYTSQLVRKGYLYLDGKLECEHCGEDATCYRITTDGRIYLNNKVGVC